MCILESGSCADRNPGGLADALWWPMAPHRSAGRAGTAQALGTHGPALSSGSRQRPFQTLGTFCVGVPEPMCLLTPSKNSAKPWNLLSSCHRRSFSMVYRKKKCDFIVGLEVSEVCDTESCVCGDFVKL